MHLDDSDKMTPLKFREKLAPDIARNHATPLLQADMEGVDVKTINCV